MSEFRRAVRYSTVENKHVVITHATTKLRHNGYPEKWLQQPEKTKSNGKSREVKYDGVLKIPFINDAFNARVHAILKRNNLMPICLVNPRPNTIEAAVKKQLLRSVISANAQSTPSIQIAQEPSLSMKQRVFVLAVVLIT